MPKYLARSAEVLNQADRLETQMTWLLFVAEQEALLAAEGYWNPGDPLYQRPGGWQHNQQTIRPIIQLMDNGQFHNGDRIYMVVRCVDCEVDWPGDEPCWACGKTPKPRKQLLEKVSVVPNHTVSDVLRANMLYSMQAAFYQQLYEIVANSEATEPLVNAASRLSRMNDLTIRSYYDIDNNRYSLGVERPRDFECPEEFNELFTPFYIDRGDLLNAALDLPIDLNLQRRTPPLPDRFEPEALRRVIGNIPPVPYYLVLRDSENEDAIGIETQDSSME